MANAAIDFPRPGTKITYQQALRAYDALEAQALGKVFSSSYSGNTGMYDLLWDVQSVAEKYDVNDSRHLRKLNKLVRQFNGERTALANGRNGERFHLMGDAAALERYDESHLFEVGVDGQELLSCLDDMLAQLSKEAAETDEYADVFVANDRTMAFGQPLFSQRHERIAAYAFAFMFVCFGIAFIAHGVFDVGFCSKWFL